MSKSRKKYYREYNRTRRDTDFYGGLDVFQGYTVYLNGEEYVWSDEMDQYIPADELEDYYGYDDCF